MPIKYDQEYLSGAYRTSILDYAGRQQFNTVFGESVIGWKVDNISIQFQYGNSTRDLVMSSTGSATVTNVNSMLSTNVGTAVGTATAQSLDPIRYRPGHEITAQYTSLFSGSEANVKQYHGMMNGQDGAAFGYNGTQFGIWFIANGVETFYPQTAWLGDNCLPSNSKDFVLDPSKLNIYQVQYGWLGVAPIVFSIYTGFSTGWRVVHWIDRANIATTPHLGNPSLPITQKIVRDSGTGSNLYIRSSSWRGGVTAGTDETISSNRWTSHTVLDHIFIDSARNNILSLRNNLTHQSKTNHVVCELGVVAFTNAVNKVIAFYGTKGATLTGNSAFADINTANSVMSYSTGGTVTGGIRGPATIVSSNSGIRTDVLGTGIIIYPGETFTIEAAAGSSGATGTVSVSVRWIEYF